MADNEERVQRRRPWLRALLAAIAVLLLALFGPPLVSINRYRGQITNLVSQSLGRPVRLSSVEARLLPWPGFVLSDLSVAEDPAYGSEPVLHANTVKVSLRLFALMAGRLEISTISVDEASLNLVRAGPGRWNLDTLFRTAASQTGARIGAGAPVHLPTLEATDSRIDFKNGVEKLPFSIVDADMTVWQESPGEWRVRLRGQPARTDVSMYLEDTGVVRMEASVRHAPALREMPVHLDLDWGQAQLGQLARLVTGSDSGWRGDLTGELHLDGTADAAKVAMRLRASGVHREEFVPASPLDFDANCSLLFHYTERSLENVACDSPLGDGRLQLTGDKPGDAPPSFTLELNRIPVEAGLDALRTLRNGLQPDLEAAGTISGKLEYAVRNPANSQPAAVEKPAGNHRERAAERVPSPLTGSLTVENLVLTGGGLTRSIQAAKIMLAPVAATPAAGRAPAIAELPPTPDSADAIAGSVAIPAGAATPLTMALRFSFTGYQVGVHGQASIPRAREIAHAAGIPETAALASLAGEPITVDLVAEGPWLPAEVIPISEMSPPLGNPDASPPSAAAAASTAAPVTTDTLTGTVTLHNANWKADYLANHLEISEATLHLNSGSLTWDPVAFSYGPVKGTATLMLPQGCSQQAELCPAQLKPSFSITFGDLDAAQVQTALLGARERGTLLSTLIERLHPSTAPPWPQLEGNVTAASLVLGPVKLEKISAALEILPDGAEVASLSAVLLGGNLRLNGSLHRPATDQDKPSYSLTGDFDGIDAKALGQLLGLRWTGSSISGNGKVDLAGYTDADLAASAKGTLHIETRYGAIAPTARTPIEGEIAADRVPEALGRFDKLTADATIADGAVTLGQNQVDSGRRRRTVVATVTLTDPPVVSFETTKSRVATR